ncbi:MAG: histidine--tRNA ligase [Chloroflexota bacterium]
MQTFQKPRGTEDILPAEMPYWRTVLSTADEMARLYGFGLVVPPTFEYTGVFARSSGEGTDVVDKEMYTFEDRGGDSLTLRPEVTAQVVRAYLQHGLHTLPQPVRLYYNGLPAFRYDRPQAGRLREHHQFGCEVIGEQDATVDAELIELLWRFYERLGLRDLTLLVNSIGCPLCRPAYIERLVAYYRQHEAAICDDCRSRLTRNPLRLLDCKKAGCQRVIAGAPHLMDMLGPECREHWESLRHGLEARDVPYTINPRLVRGLDYYTKTVFEFVPRREGAQSTIGGGGRYDGLAEVLGGKPTPGIGFATGIERIVLNMKEAGSALEPPRRAEVYVAPLAEAARDATAVLLGRLRGSGLSALAAARPRSLKAQLRDANAAGAGFACIIGDDELAAGAAAVKDLRAEGGAQRLVPLSEVVEYIKRGGGG